MKPRVLSGIQPTGNLHLGNYLGAIRNWVAMQDSHQCLFMLADLHAITIPQKPEELTQNTREMAAALVACGIDPKRSIIFPQSAVSMHAELAWILSCHTPLGWLNRMTQFKEKAGLGLEETLRETLLSSVNENFKFNEELSKELLNSAVTTLLRVIKQAQENKDRAMLGLYSYPVLMAADIIGYHATHVPVGEDQKQHLELSRDIAGAFNRAYKEDFFPIPEPLIMPQAARIMSLNDGTRKMSKSEESDYSRVNLTDDADTISKKFKKAKSDSHPTITYDPENRPEAANLLQIYAALAGITIKQATEKFAGKNFGALKGELAELAVAKLGPITAKMRELMKDTAALDKIIREGAEAANAIAEPILKETKKRVGFLNV